MKNLLVLSLVAIAGVASAQNLVKNGSFTADSYPVNSAVGVIAVTDWTPSFYAAGQNLAGCGVGYLGQTMQEVDLSGTTDVYAPGGVGPELSQTISDVKGQTYKVSFDYFTNLNGVNAGGLNFGINWNATAYAGDLESTTGTTTPSVYTTTFVGTGSDDIEFVAAHGQVCQIGNVSVQAVPEPVSMVTLGLGVIGFLKRKKN